MSKLKQILLQYALSLAIFMRFLAIWWMKNNRRTYLGALSSTSFDRFLSLDTYVCCGIEHICRFWEH